jgi:tRNA-dihydrouridine synthase
VKTPADARRMRDETGCDGVMVGRAAISNPWALAAISAEMRGEAAPPLPTLLERIDVVREHARSMVEFEAVESGEDISPAVELRALSRLRGQLPMYIKGEPGASQMRARLSRVSSLQELDDLLGEFLTLSAAAV